MRRMRGTAAVEEEEEEQYFPSSLPLSSFSHFPSLPYTPTVSRSPPPLPSSLHSPPAAAAAHKETGERRGRKVRNPEGGERGLSFFLSPGLPPSLLRPDGAATNGLQFDSADLALLLLLPSPLLLFLCELPLPLPLPARKKAGRGGDIEKAKEKHLTCKI